MYKTANGKSIILGKELGKGGAATVYLDANNKEKAIKIFNAITISKETNLKERVLKFCKLYSVANLDVNYGNKIMPVGSFPQETVFDKSGKVVGYIMASVPNTMKLTYICQAFDPGKAFHKFKKEKDPNYNHWKEKFLYNPKNIKNRFILCYYLTLAFNKIYEIKPKSGNGNIELDICNFDIKPDNILVTKDGFPFLLDLDNLTLINKTDKLAPNNPQCTPHYKAPEGAIDKHYDYFSIAVIFYELLFSLHPFTVKGGTRFTDGTEAPYFINQKCFAWGRNRKFLYKESLNDPYHSNFQRLPTDLQNLFIRALDNDIPSNRPSMIEWHASFQKILTNKNLPLEKLFKVPGY